MDLASGARFRFHLGQEQRRRFLVDGFLAAVLADLRGNGFYHERKPAPFQGDGGAAGRGFAFSANRTFHGPRLVK